MERVYYDTYNDVCIIYIWYRPQRSTFFSHTMFTSHCLVEYRKLHTIRAIHTILKAKIPKTQLVCWSGWYWMVMLILGRFRAGVKSCLISAQWTISKSIDGFAARLCFFASFPANNVYQDYFVISLFNFIHW